MSDQRRVIVVVPGARYLRSSNPFVQKGIVRLYGLFNVIPDYSGSEEAWIPALRQRGYEVIRFEWNGSVTSKSLHLASKRLSDLITTEGVVSVISCSIGTLIALLAAGRTILPLRVISLCGVFRTPDTPGDVIDIRSTADRFGNFFRSVSEMFSRKSSGLRTVMLSGIRHDEFGDNPVIPSGIFENSSLSDIILSFLD
ncbi:MAG TPA: hypothetical protein VN420_02270 [Candidatus Fimivivens sp.]|nr:hypothetical protein [Candidatus Fimivivens sp.]